MNVVGVVFSSGGRVQLLDPGDLELAWNDRVICTARRGEEYGRVVQPNHVPEEQPRDPLQRVLRRATPDDEERRRAQREQAAEVRRRFRRRAVERAPGVKVHGAEMPFDGGRVVIAFSAEERTDLRPVARALSEEVGLRVEARQVGPREGARITGGYGLCGDVLCCTRFPTTETRVTLRMAKDQGLPVGHQRITGLCGRLRCCLAFEHPVYRDFRERAPAVGRKVDTPQGRGVVRSYHVPEGALGVAIDGMEGEVVVPLDDAVEVGGRS
jgi:cell fate regulator YaaT (PSP1 superfamily)